MSKFYCDEIKSSHGPGPFFGRFLISIIFILAGIGKIFNFDSSVVELQSYGIQNTQVWIVVALLMELIGGILMLLGWHTRFGVIILMIFLLPVTFIVHSFWNYAGAAKMLQFSNFLKNIAIYGGLLMVFSYGPGRWSLDALRWKRNPVKNAK